MKKLVSSALAVALMLGLAAPAMAAKEKATPEDTFKKLDKDSDGKVSLAEFKGKREGDKAANAEKQFKAKDKDNDGFLTLDEYKAAPVKKKK